ncbi:hypothetical protein GMB86_10450 [Terrilactibacillus sp. BCM23-1]|uniref:Uncharacterized protein n=2 Tax=Terrilactibacillus tamarindi TaxID=2599694 RepID=A0A6N8CVQ5_9BACI|nr:hypothetical protein [Terrilactibacillus tamarindi]
MKKTILTFSTALMMTGVLAGCGANNDRNAAFDNNGRNNMRDVGYYTDRNADYNDVTRRNGRNMQNTDNFNNRVARDNNLGYNNNANNNNNMAYDPTNDQRDARQIARAVGKIDGVRNANVVVYNNDVLIGINAENNRNLGKLREHVYDKAKSITPNKRVRVATDRRTVDRITNVNNRILNDGGNVTNEVGNDIAGILSDIGNAVQRPFQNNAR